MKWGRCVSLLLLICITVIGSIISSVWDTKGEQINEIKGESTSKSTFFNLYLDSGSSENIVFLNATKVIEQNLSQFLKTDKITYLLGEKIIITIDPLQKENREVIISSEKEDYRFFGLISNNLTFLPIITGNYSVKLVEKSNQSIIASQKITVFEKNPALETPREQLFTISANIIRLGDPIAIDLSAFYQILPNNSTTNYSFFITGQDDRFALVGDLSPFISFIPKAIGEYTVTLEENTSILEAQTFVVEEQNLSETLEPFGEEDLILLEDNAAILVVDFSPLLHKRNILFKLFQLDRIKKLNARIEGNDADRFTLALTKVGVDKFQFDISQLGPTKDIYYPLNIVAETSDQLVNITKIIKASTWTEIEPADETAGEIIIENVSENLTGNETVPPAVDQQQNQILKVVNFSFKKDQDAFIPFDLGEDTDRTLSIFDLAFKKTIFNEVTVYIEDHEDDPSFALNLSHEEFDKFLVGIRANESISPDIYVLVIKASNQDLRVTKKIIFNWGLEDLDQIKEKANKIRESILLSEVHAANVSQIPKNVSQNITELNETTPQVPSQVSEINVSVIEQNKAPKKEPRQITPNIDLRDSKKRAIPVTVKFYDTNGSLIHSIEKSKPGLRALSAKTIPAARYRVEIVPEQKSIRKLALNNVQVDGNLSFQMEDVPEKKVNLKHVQKAFAINLDNLNFSDGTMEVIATGSSLLKCKDWSFDQEKCLGSWTEIAKLIPGQPYLVAVDPGDPAYAETGIASINTKKSIYHPGEQIDIIMVVLNTEGHLVSNAKVNLTVTSPSAQLSKFSSELGTIQETETGIYETSFVQSSEEGNFTLEVFALGNKVNNTMISYVAVKSFYEFDILRNTPVTTDPFQAPFTSSIKVISLNGVSTFDLTEVLPINFSIISAPNAVIATTGDLIFLTWHNVANNSERSYTVRPPLISPELYQMGKAFVNYSGSIFEEARPWYLAVDPTLSDTSILTNTSSLLQNTQVNVTSVLLCSGGGAGINFDVWLMDDGERINNTASGNDFACGSGSVNVNSCAATCVANANCSVSVSSCNNGNAMNFTYTLNASGNREALSSSNTILANGSQGTFNDQVTVTITANADVVAPNITLIDPVNETWKTTKVFNVTFNATTNDNIGNCSVWTNQSGWSLKQTNTSLVLNATNHSINVTFSIDRDFLWNVRCYDNTDNKNFSQNNFTVRIDSIAPAVTALNEPANDSYVFASPIDFNFTATDNLYFLNCSLWSNFSTVWQQNYSLNSTVNNTKTNITSGPADGVYWWNVRCHDGAGLFDFYDGNNTITVDTSPPIVNLESPANNSEWSTSSTVNFAFNVSDLSSLRNCSLNINNFYNKSNTSFVAKVTPNQVISYALNNGNYTWRINCTDAGFRTSNSTAYNVSVRFAGDKFAPTITMVYPANNSAVRRSSNYLNVTTDENASCKYNTTTDFNFTNFGVFFNGNGTMVHGVSLGTLPEGYYNYFIKCNDSSGNANNASNQISVNFSVDRTFPQVTLNLPNDTMNSSPIDVNFNWTATDASFGDVNISCNLTVNDAVAAEAVNSPNNTAANYSIAEGTGTYLWNVTCVDDAGNTNVSSSRNFTIDGSPPSFVAGSISAKPGTAAAGAVVLISANVTDSSGISSVYVNVTRRTSGASFRSQMTQTSGSQYQYNFTSTGTVDTYDYYIIANDTASPVPNSQSSSSFSFSIQGTRTILSIQTENQTYKSNKSVLLISSMYSLQDVESAIQSSNATQRNSTNYTCTNTWGSVCSSGLLDDTFDTCNIGSNSGTQLVNEVYVNSTVVKNGDTVLATCEFDAQSASDSWYIYYYNGNTYTQASTGAGQSGSLFNKTIAITINSATPNQYIRCIIDNAGENDQCADSAEGGHKEDNDDVLIRVGYIIDENGNDTRLTNYTDFGQNYTKLSDIDIRINIQNYSNRGSLNVSNTNPDLLVSVYNGTEYVLPYLCEAGSLGNPPFNCTQKIKDATILEAWKNTSNRKLQLSGVYLDTQNNFNDSIRWNNVLVELQTSSKLENYGILNLSAILLLQVLRNDSNNWKVNVTIFNGSIIANLTNDYNITERWNPTSWSTDHAALGSYRAFVALTDSSGGVLQTNDDGTNISDFYTFKLDYLRITVESPLNGSQPDATGFWANITLSYDNFKSGNWCAFSLDNRDNVTMKNDTETHFFNFTNETTVGLHNLTFYCNDTAGDVSFLPIIINATDQSGPRVYPESPSNGQDGLASTVVFAYNVTDIVSSIKNCTLFVDGARRAANTTVTEGISQNFTATGLSSGVHDWAVKCYDNSTNENLGTSATYEFTVGSDVVPPDIFLGDPQDNTISSNNDMVFYFGVLDELSGIANCSLILNNSINATKNTSNIVESFNNNDNNFTVLDMRSGVYNWSINCTDTSSNKNTQNASLRNITIIQDTDFPSLYLVSPSNGTTFASGNIQLQFNASDASSGLKNCSLRINNTRNQSMISPAEYTILTFSLNGMRQGDYNWSVECYDDSFQENRNISQVWYFSITILQSLNINVTVNGTQFQKGSQVNETIYVTTLIQDQLGAFQNGSVRTDIISGNTSLRWWNTSWKYRIPLLFNGTAGRNLSNASIEVNLTGLGGNISSCENELRIIRNESLSFYEVPLKFRLSDNATFCTFDFFANISSSAIAQNNYFVYYNNSAAANPNYNLDFHNRTINSCTNTWGTDCTTGTNDDTFDSCNPASTDANTFVDEAYANETRVFKGDEVNVSCAFEAKDTGDAVAIWYFNGLSWSEQMSGNADSSLLYNESFVITVSSNEPVQYARCIIDNGAYESDNCASSGLKEDNDDVLFYVGADYRNQSSFNDSQRLINRSLNRSSPLGNWTFNISSALMQVGNYSAVSYVESAVFSNGTNYTVFSVILDNSAPVVNLFDPITGNVSETGNLTFVYNVSDTYSSINNCTLIINSSVNRTNASITEDIPLNFSLDKLRNGDYTWNVNCTDNATNRNTGSATSRTFAVHVDAVAPVIQLITPINGFNDTNGNITFFYNVTDDFQPLTTCSIIINETVNQSATGVNASGATQNFSINYFNDGSYVWQINCSDNSLQNKSNVSLLRNVTVTIDTAPPSVEVLSPADPAQSTNGNVSFLFNVSDAISDIASCRLIINGTINKSNSSGIDKRIIQNFTVIGINTGFYQYNISCTDASEYSNVNTTTPTRNLTVATDTAGPTVNLEFPPNNAQFTNPNVTFRYNASDFASAISNCTLIINGTVNTTNRTIVEGQSLNFSLDYLRTGDYTWQVNCTDDSSNANVGSSALRNLTIGVDQTPPVITQNFPQNNTYVDTDGNVTFKFTVEDLASDISNCSIYLDSIRNQSKTGIIETDPNQNFTIAGMQTAIHNWTIECTDTANPANKANSTTIFFNVTLDNNGPTINLEGPAHLSIDTNGNVTFLFNVTDDISGIANCSVIINNTRNASNTTLILESTPNQNISVNNMNNGNYTWYLNCTDDSDNLNVNSSVSRNITILKDTWAPRVFLEAPANDSKESDGERTFYYNVTDDLSDITSCSLIFNGVVQKTNTSVAEAISQNFSLSGLTTQNYSWNVNCTDTSEYRNVNTSLFRNLSVIIDTLGPIINLTTPLNDTQDTDNNVTFFYNATDVTSGLTNCTLILNGTKNITNQTFITEGQIENFTLSNIRSGDYIWNINCTDDSEILSTTSSEIRYLRVGADADPPIVSLIAPDQDQLITDNSVLFEYSVVDYASSIANCSLFLGNVLNKTNTTVTESVNQNFTVTGLNNGNYFWFINCTDTSLNNNTGNSSFRNFTVGADTIGPNITLVLPENNTRMTSGNALFVYNVTDATSGIFNCSLLFDGRFNQSNTSLVVEGIYNNFSLTNVPEGNYNWSIRCFDNSGNRNFNTSEARNISVDFPDVFQVNISTNLSSYDQGTAALINVSVADNRSNALAASVTVDVIFGNASASWWNTSWRYRVPVQINSTNVSRKDNLIEQQINFSSVLIADLGLNGKIFHENSTRVIEWKNNRSVEVPSEFRRASSFNNGTNALGTVLWVLNGTTAASTARNYYVYFDTFDDPKTTANYSTPAYAFNGSTSAVTFNGTGTSAERLTIKRNQDSLTVQFGEGTRIINQDNIDYQSSGALSNLTLNNTLISNLFSAIAPFAVKTNDYLYANGTSVVTPGPVVTSIHIPSNISTINPSVAEVNYTIWFTDDEIRIRADLYAKFGQAENAPSVRYQNLWFPYIMSNFSNWESFLFQGESNTLNRTNQYNNKVPAGQNTRGVSSWYTERGPAGSINVYAETFKKNSVDNSKGVVIYDDGYDTAPESDTIGLSFDDITISANTDYQLRVWIIVSRSNASTRAQDLEDDVATPVTIVQGLGQKWVNRTSGTIGALGTFAFSWSTSNQTVGSYAATASVNQSFFDDGFNFTLFTVTPDIYVPNVSIGQPSGWKTAINQTFDYNVSDNNQVLQNCTLIIRNQKNRTNTSIVNDGVNYFTLDNLPEQKYNWTVNCTDPSGNVGSTDIKTFYIDRTPPSINLSAPLDLQILNYSTVIFNFSVFDNLADSLFCNMTLNGQLNVSNINAVNSTITTFNITGMSEGNHTWNITCLDNATNRNRSLSSSFLVDLGAPTITLNRPNGNWTNKTNLTFYYTPSDVTGVTGCSIMIDGKLNKTNTSIDNSLMNNFSIDNFNEGAHNWTVNCTDVTGFVGSATPYLFYVDRGPPTINLTGPPSGAQFSFNSLSLNFSVTDNLDPGLLCNITINSTVNNTVEIAVNNGSEFSFNQTGFKDFTFSWNVTCKDNASNTNTSSTFTFTVQKAPTLKLQSPANLTRSNDRNTTFFFIPKDNSGKISNCTVILNKQKNFTNLSIAEGVQNGITPKNLPHGQYNWTVNCTDQNENIGANDTIRILYLDLLGPSVILNYPAGGNINQNDINFNFTATEQFDLPSNSTCNITLDGSINVSNINAVSGVPNITLISNLTNGLHTWNVTCKDDLNNTNVSLSSTFNINAPDLFINSSEIRFNDSLASELETINISAIVYNLGGIDADNALIAFYDGNPAEGGTIIINLTLPTLSSGANISLNATWLPTIGQHVIYVVADQHNSIDELNETNNNASAPNNVSIYQTVYGNITGILEVRDTVNQTIFVWNISQNPYGYIFITDLESAVTWSNLSALGVNTTLGNVSDDFNELDRRLNTSQYNDSINITFTVNSLPRNDTDLVLFKKSVPNVPIVNINASSSFYTGILWDVSDDLNGQYNGSEDIIFISQVKRLNQGAYGTYDYEIRVPSTLRKYYPSDQNTVLFYAELI